MPDNITKRDATTPEEVFTAIRRDTLNAKLIIGQGS